MTGYIHQPIAIVRLLYNYSVNVYGKRIDIFLPV